MRVFIKNINVPISVAPVKAINVDRKMWYRGGYHAISLIGIDPEEEKNQLVEGEQQDRYLTQVHS